MAGNSWLWVGSCDRGLSGVEANVDLAALNTETGSESDLREPEWIAKPCDPGRDGG